MSNPDQFNNDGYPLDLKIEPIGDGRVRGITQFPTQEGFTFQIEVIGREENVQQFNGSRILQASFEPMTEEQVQDTINQKIQQQFDQQHERWGVRLKELSDFIQQASPEQLALLEGGWKHGFPHQDVFKYLNEGFQPDPSNLANSDLNDAKRRIINIDLVDAPSLYGRLFLVIDPDLTDSNTFDIYNPNESGYLTATTIKSDTNTVTMTLSRGGNHSSEFVAYAEGLSTVEGNSGGGIQLTVAAKGYPCTYTLATDTLRQWNQVN